MSLKLGGKLDAWNAAPLAVTATVRSVNADPALTYTVDPAAGTGQPPRPRPAVMPRAAVVDVPCRGGAVHVTLTAARKLDAREWVELGNEIKPGMAIYFLYWLLKEGVLTVETLCARGAWRFRTPPRQTV